MTHKVVAIKCNFARGKLVITAIGASPRGTKVLLRKATVDGYDPRDPADRNKVKAAVESILQPAAG